MRVWRVLPLTTTGSAREVKTCDAMVGKSWSQRITSSPLLERDNIKCWRREGTFKANVKAVGDTLQTFAMAFLDAVSTVSGFLSNEVRVMVDLRRTRDLLVSGGLLIVKTGFAVRGKMHLGRKSYKRMLNRGSQCEMAFGPF